MKVAVIGAGISGLTVAHELVKRGQDVVVLEAAPRVGGTIQSTQAPGYLTEAGPNGFLANEPATLALVEELGLSPKLRSAEPASKRRFVYSRGKVNELKMGPGLFANNVLPFWGRLRLLGEPFTPRPKDAGDETLHAFMKRHLGVHATEILIDAMQSGIFAGDPTRLSVAAVFPRLAEIERDHRSLIVGMMKARRAGERKSPTAGSLTSFEGGLELLPRTLGERLGDRVRRGSEVRGLERDGDGWRVLAQGAGPVRADRVVLATPAYVSAALLRPMDAALAQELDAIEYAAASVVHLGFDDPALAERIAGFGMLAPERESRRILGALYIHSFFPWRVDGKRALITVIVGGARHPDRANLADDALVAMVREELGSLLQIQKAPSFQQIVRWPRAIPQYNVGHLARLERVQARLEKLPHVHLSGNAYRGVGVNDCVRNGVQTAARVAAP